MKAEKISQELIQETIRFHGHSCPGLAIGIRAAEWALMEMGKSPDEEIVAVVETDMCGVDAIQYLIGCTFGKGNLIHKDYGKTAFTFYRRRDGKGVRIVTRQEARAPQDDEFTRLRKKKMAEGLDGEEEKKFKAAMGARTKKIMDTPLEELFEIKEPQISMPRKARILHSLICGECGEAVMETRTRRFNDQVLCIPCFDALEK